MEYRNVKIELLLWLQRQDPDQNWGKKQDPDAGTVLSTYLLIFESNPYIHNTVAFITFLSGRKRNDGLIEKFYLSSAVEMYQYAMYGTE